jgi:hypothetical protein
MAEFSEDLPVDPEVDPQAQEFIPSEIESGFYDNTPVNELQAEELQEVPTPEDPVPVDEIKTSGSTTLTPEELDALAAANGVDAGDGGNIPESALYRNETASQNPYTQLNTGTFTGPGFQLNPTSEAAAITQGFANQARQQQTLKQQRKQVNNADWRVRLRLAPGAQYLYNAPNPGILQPLRVTDGVIFPYTPTIDTVYKAEYDPYTLTHSNYKGYFYKSSYVDQVTLRCPFTAQSTSEANYLLAVITFFKSATKMFYGQDAERGSPPPLVYLSGYGEYQFNEHPSVITQFTLNLPSDVDYIRAGSPNNNGLNLTTLRDRQSTALPSSLAGLQRLANAFLKKGALPSPPSPPSLTTNNPTYVPTKMEINITLLPVQSRQQVSKQFSVKEFANGNLIKGGFW